MINQWIDSCSSIDANYQYIGVLRIDVYRLRDSSTDRSPFVESFEINVINLRLKSTALRIDRSTDQLVAVSDRRLLNLAVATNL